MLEMEKNPLVRFIYRLDDDKPIEKEAPHKDANPDEEKNPLIRFVNHMDED